MFCPFHDFREPLQFYGSNTLFVTSLWFFTWQSGNPLEDFGLFLFIYSILVYLPFLYFWFQCSHEVEYETGGDDSTSEIHLSHNARERTVRVLLKLSHLAEEEIFAVGQPLLPQPAKKETGMYISQPLKGQFGAFSLLCFIVSFVLIPLHLGAFVGGFAMIAVLPAVYLICSNFNSFGEKIFTIPIACSSSQCLIFIHISFDSIEVVSMSQVGLSDKLFHVAFPSPDKVQLVPCTKIGNWELPSGGVLNWEKNEYQRKVLPSIDIFPSVCSGTSYLQFQGDEIAKKFRDSWFGFSPECRNLSQIGWHLDSGRSPLSFFLGWYYLVGSLLLPFHC